MFKKNDRDTLRLIYSKLVKVNFDAISNERDIMIQQEVIDHQRNIIDSLLDVLCEKYTDQTLIIGFGKDVRPFVIQNGERVTEDKLKSIHYDWIHGNTESIHIEYKKE